MSAFRLHKPDGTTQVFSTDHSVALWYDPNNRWGHIEVRNAEGRLVGGCRTGNLTWHTNLAGYYAWFTQHLAREVEPMPRATEHNFISELYNRIHGHNYSEGPDEGAIRILEVELYTLTNPVSDVVTGFDRTISWRRRFLASWRAPAYLRDPTEAHRLLRQVSMCSVYRGTGHETVRASLSRMNEVLCNGEYLTCPLSHTMARCLVLEMLSRLRTPHPQQGGSDE